jgi:hypothetical protein
VTHVYILCVRDTVLTARHCTGSYRGLGSMVWNLGPDPDPADGTEDVEEVED